MAEVTKLCEDFWAWRMRDSPEFATYCGNHDYDDKLDDVTTEAYDRRQVSASIHSQQGIWVSFRTPKPSKNTL